MIVLLLGITIAQTILGQKLYLPEVDNSSYRGKAMFGYQGWFGHPDDNSPRPNYWHWGNMDNISISSLSIDMYPDMREYNSEERYETAYTLPNGDVAPVFSAGNRETVKRHIKWVRDYNTDGVWVQRFISEYNDRVVMAFRDSTTVFVKEGCEDYGRVFAIMYDGIADRVEDIKKDWKHLVDDLEITDSDRYLHHNNRPLVALWGYTVRSEATVDQLEELIDFFHNNPDSKYRASIKLGVNDNWWKKDQRWLNAFKQVEVISPWSVGRFDNQSGFNSYLANQVKPSKNWCDQYGILYVPVLFPGFGWYNLRNGDSPMNKIPREGGNFFWLQAYGIIKEGVESVYFAMLDEVDESTAFFKTAENSSMAPAQQKWLLLDADGYELPSDWYLRCAGKAAEMLRGNINLTADLGNPDEGIMTIYPGIDDCNITFKFPQLSDVTKLEISIDGGDSFPYSVDGSAGQFKIDNLNKGTYNIYIRDTYSIKDAVCMGKVSVNADCVATSATNIAKNASSSIKVYPNPFNSVIYLSGLPNNSRIEVLDVRGHICISYNSENDLHKLDVSKLKAGMYFVKISNETGTIIRKITKNQK